MVNDLFLSFSPSNLFFFLYLLSFAIIRFTVGGTFDETNGLFCGPTTARNLFWNFTRVGDINVQPCPGGATGIAKWRCSGSLLPTVHLKRHRNSDENTGDNSHPDIYDPNNGYMWQPSTPDLTQCRSLWLNSLEVRVSSRDSALVSIANDLSQVLYHNINKVK